MRFTVDPELELFAESVHGAIGGWEAPLEPAFGAWQDDRDDALAARLEAVGWGELWSDPALLGPAVAGGIELGRAVAPLCLVDDATLGAPARDRRSRPPRGGPGRGRGARADARRDRHVAWRAGGCRTRPRAAAGVGRRHARLPGRSRRRSAREGGRARAVARAVRRAARSPSRCAGPARRCRSGPRRPHPLRLGGSRAGRRASRPRASPGQAAPAAR